MEEGEMKTSGPSVLMVGEKEFLKTLEEGDGVGFALVLNPKEDVVDKKVEIPLKVQELLN